MPYKTQTSIVIPKETKARLISLKLPDETWDAFFNTIIDDLLKIMGDQTDA